MKAFLDLFGGFSKVMWWFFTAIVIPVTTWVMVLRYDVITLQSQYKEASAQIIEIKKTVNSQAEENNKALVEIQRSLGRIEGEIKRIK